MAANALAVERDWARSHPVPRWTVNDDLLILWNYPVDKSDLSQIHKEAILAFLDSEWKLGAWASNVELTVLGNASDTGDPKTNEELARARARKVAQFMRGQGAPARSIVVDSAGSTQPIDDAGDGEALAKNRRVDITKTTRVRPVPPPPTDLGGKPPEPEPEPPEPWIPEPPAERPSRLFNPAPAFVEFQIPFKRDLPFKIRNNWVMVDFELEGVITLKVPTGAATKWGLAGIMTSESLTPQGKVDIVEGVIGKASFKPSEGEGPATIKIGVQNKNWPLKPEGGWQFDKKKPGMPVYITLTQDTPINGRVVLAGVPADFTVTIKLKSSVGPGPGTLARIARAGAAAGDAAVAASEAMAAAAPAVGAVAGASGAAIGVAALVIGGTIAAVSQAKQDGIRYCRLLAERDGASSRIALEILGDAERATFLNQRQNWNSLPDIGVSDFDTGVRAVEAVIPKGKEDLDGKKRGTKRDAWKARVASDTSNFMIIRDRVFLAIGGTDREGTVEDALADW